MYRLVLDRHEGDRVLFAVQALIERGSHFRPSVAEVVAAINADSGLPTWAEACRVLFGPKSITWEPWRQRDTHEVIDLFVASQGLDRLQTLPLNDPDWGHVELRLLGEEYDQHVQRYLERKREHRAVEALGRPRSGELGRPDWAALSGEPPDVGAQAGATSSLLEGSAGRARSPSGGRLRSLDPPPGLVDAHEADSGTDERGGAPADTNAASDEGPA